MGKIRLTRKEIIGEDPVHDAIVQLIEFFREQGKMIAAVAGIVILLGLGLYWLLDYRESREFQAQQHLAKAMSFFHGRIDVSATDDPYGKGPEPAFRSETAKYQAAGKEFSSIIRGQGSSKLGLVARYYLGLCQLQLGQKNEAVQSLETVRNNTKDRTLAYLAKKVLAEYYLNSGNHKAAQETLEGMVKDPQCQLPKEDLRLDLARVYEAQGKRDEALKVLREARDQNSYGVIQTLLNRELERLEGSSALKPEAGRPSTALP